MCERSHIILKAGVNRTKTHLLDAFLTVLRLPPGFEAVVGEGGDHVLDSVAVGVAVLVVHQPGVARETFFLLLTKR